MAGILRCPLGCPRQGPRTSRNRPRSINRHYNPFAPGYLRKNGVPYSANAHLNEYFVRLVDNGGQEYLALTILVDDPQYLQQPYIKTYQYKKQRDASGWNPTPCSAR